MNAKHQTIFAIDDDCVRLCLALRDCLQSERTALVSLQLDAIQQTNLTKESLGTALRNKKKDLVEALRVFYSVDSSAALSAKLEVSERQEWIARQERWGSLWNETRNLCERNQQFLEHSLRNFGNLVEHLKRLLGEGGTYSARGQHIGSKSSGRIVEGKY